MELTSDVAPKKKREGSIEDVNMDMGSTVVLNGQHHEDDDEGEECIQSKSITTTTLIEPETAASPEVSDKPDSSELSLETSLESETGQPEKRFLAQQYGFVKNLFDKLPMRDLLNCGKVNKLWSEISRVVRKSRRNQIFLILYHPYLPHTKQILEWYNGQIGNAVSTEAKDFVEKVLSGSDFSSYPRVCEQVRPAILEAFNTCYYEPQLVIFFGSQSLNSFLSKRNTPRQRYTRYEHLFEGINVLGPALAAFGTGVVTTIENSGETIESENEAYPLLTGLAIPKVPGLHVKTFNVDFGTASKYKGKVDSVNCKEILNIGPDDKVKGIILFQSMTRRCSALSDAIFQYLLQNPETALGGGIIYEGVCSSCPEKASKGCGLIICGQDNVKVMSVGLFHKKMSPANEKALQRVKSVNFEEEGSFAFMFVCNGRGKMHNDVSNFESRLFRKYFPRTVLVGAFTGGEYVHEYIPGQPTKPPSSKKSIEYTFVTVFVIVSIARTSNNQLEV